MWTDFNQESSHGDNLNGSLCSVAQLVTGKLAPAGYFERLEFMTKHTQTISDFRQCPIPRVHEERIVMKARVKKRQFLRVQVTVKVRGACNPSHYIRLNLACQFNAHCTSIGWNWMLLFVFLLSDDTPWRIHIVCMHCFQRNIYVKSTL